MTQARDYKLEDIQEMQGLLQQAEFIQFLSIHLPAVSKKHIQLLISVAPLIKNHQSAEKQSMIMQILSEIDKYLPLNNVKVIADNYIAYKKELAGLRISPAEKAGEPRLSSNYSPDFWEQILRNEFLANAFLAESPGKPLDKLLYLHLAIGELLESPYLDDLNPIFAGIKKDLNAAELALLPPNPTAYHYYALHMLHNIHDKDMLKRMDLEIVLCAAADIPGIREAFLKSPLEEHEQAAYFRQQLLGMKEAEANPIKMTDKEMKAILLDMLAQVNAPVPPVLSAESEAKLLQAELAELANSEKNELRKLFADRSAANSYYAGLVLILDKAENPQKAINLVKEHIVKDMIHWGQQAQFLADKELIKFFDPTAIEKVKASVHAYSHALATAPLPSRENKTPGSPGVMHTAPLPSSRGFVIQAPVSVASQSILPVSAAESEAKVLRAQLAELANSERNELRKLFVNRSGNPYYAGLVRMLDKEQNAENAINLVKNHIINDMIHGRHQAPFLADKALVKFFDPAAIEKVRASVHTSQLATSPLPSRESKAQVGPEIAMRTTAPLPTRPAAEQQSAMAERPRLRK